MNTEASLKLKVKTVKRMEEELANDELVESEVDDLQLLVDELRTLSEDYIKELGAEEIINRLGIDHWMVTGEAIESESTAMVLEGLEDLLEMK